MSETKHTPGAIRAARQLWKEVDLFDLPTELGVPRLAALIDRETAAPELLEACKHIATLAQSRTVNLPVELYNRLEALIAKAEGR